MIDTRHIRNLALIGFMGAGKSCVGRLAAERLHFDFLDTDESIEAQVGKSITSIFAQEGEPAFREYERQIVLQLNQRKGTVIATGGGLPVNPLNLADLKAHALVVYLWASPQSLWERVRRQRHRPLLQDPDPLANIQRLLSARDPFYRQADVLVNSERRSVMEVTQQVISQFRLAVSDRR